MSKMKSPNCTCKTTKMCFLHGLVPKGKAVQKAKDEIVCLVAKGITWVDQGMGHGHYAFKLDDQGFLDLQRCLHAINPKGRIRIQGLVTPIPIDPKESVVPYPKY